MKKKYKIIIFLVSVACILFSYAYFIEPNMLKVEHQTIKLNCLKSDISNQNFIQISDLHYTENTSIEEIYRLESEIKNQNPVAVFITGDLISDKDGIDSAIHLVEKLSNDFPIFVIFGNWDYWALDFSITDFQNKLENIGANVLINSSVELKFENESVNIIGIKDPYTSGSIKMDLEKALYDVKNNNCNILLAHSPDVIKEAAQNNINLALVGHTHGGQINIPYLTKKIIPANPDGEGYIKGLYTKDNTIMYVNRGIGTSMLPLRFLNPPEITLIKLIN
ncbi:MAG: metallophosphoesterase [Candidatus Pacebacteria bacterium]|nr:metallophosphoesterase [Candidatus Paceibacterota bacterium]